VCDQAQRPVALLLPPSGSFTLATRLTLAVFTNVPVAAELIVHTALKLTLEPAGKMTTSLRSPLPLAVQLPPLAPLQVQATLVQAAGNASLTVLPGASLGPALLATIA